MLFLLYVYLSSGVLIVLYKLKSIIYLGLGNEVFCNQLLVIMVFLSVEVSDFSFRLGAWDSLRYFNVVLPVPSIYLVYRVII